MNRFSDFLDAVLVLAEREWLFELWLKSSLLLVVIWIGYLLLRSRPVGLRRYFWRAAAVLLLALPGLSVLNYGWTIKAEVSAAPVSQDERVSAPSTEGTADYGAGSSPGHSEAIASSAPAAIEASHFESASSGSDTVIATSQSPERPPARSQFKFDYLIWIWGLGLLLALSRCLVSQVLIIRLVARSREAPAGMVQMSRDIAESLQIRKSYKLRISDHVGSPALVWSGSPVLLVPQSLLAENAHVDLRAILAHELAHVKGRDLLWNFVFHLAFAIHWVNPLVWGIRKKHALFCELQADVFSVKESGGVDNYTQTLASVALLAQNQRRQYGVPMARKGGVCYRIQQLPKTLKESRVSRRVLVYTSFILFTAGLLLGSFQVVRAAAENESADLSVKSTPVHKQAEVCILRSPETKLAGAIKEIRTDQAITTVSNSAYGKELELSVRFVSTDGIGDRYSATIKVPDEDPKTVEFSYKGKEVIIHQTDEMVMLMRPEGTASVGVTNSTEEDRNSQTAPEKIEFAQDVGYMDVSIVDNQGQPIEEAELEVIFYNLSRAGKEVEVDRIASGSYRISLPEDEYREGTVRLRVNAEGYVPLVSSWHNIQNQPLPRQYQFKLDKGTYIGGLVKNDEGEPVPNATVTLIVPHRGPEQFRVDIFNHEFMTDEKGRWRCDIMPPVLGDLWMKVGHPDYPTRSVSQQPAIEELREGRAVLELKSGYALSGVVHGPAGQPVANAQVARGTSKHQFDDSFERVTTNLQGRFTFPLVPEGELTLTTLVEGLAPDMRTINMDRDRDQVEVNLEAGYPLRLKVVDQEGNPVSAVVIPERWNGNATLEHEHIHRRSTKRDGTWEWLWAPKTAVDYTVFASGYIAKRGLLLSPDEDYQIIEMQPEVHASVSVIDAETEEPLPTFSYIPGRKDTERDSIYWEERDKTLGRDGQFKHTFGDSATGGYTFRIEAEGYRAIELPTIDASVTRHELSVRMVRGQQIQGRVLGLDGAPAENAVVSLYTEAQRIYVRNGRVNQRHGGVAHIVTDRDGQFTFNPLEDSYKIVVTHDTGMVIANSESLSVDGSLRLQPWRSVSGRVRIGDRIGANERIGLWDFAEINGVAFNSDFKTDEDGYFETGRVAPGLYLLNRRVINDQNRETGSAPVQIVDTREGDVEKVQLGGAGVAVRGRFDTSSINESFIWDFHNEISLRPRSMVSAQVPPGASPEERAEAYRRFNLTEAGQRQRLVHSHRYPINIDDKGAFEVEAVEPGDYLLTVRAIEPTSEINDRTVVGQKTVTFSVPEAASQPIDLGKLKLTAASEAVRGRPLPDFALKTLSGEGVRSRDFIGQPLLIDLDPYKSIHGNHPVVDRLLETHPELKILRVYFDPAPKRREELSALKKQERLLHLVAEDFSQADFLLRFGKPYPWPVGWYLFDDEGRFLNGKIKEDKLLEQVPALLSAQQQDHSKPMASEADLDKVSAEAEKSEILISVTEQGIEFNGQEVPREQLEERIKGLAKDTQVRITADPSLRHGKVMPVMEMCREAGLRFTISVEKREETPPERRFVEYAILLIDNKSFKQITKYPHDHFGFSPAGRPMVCKSVFDHIDDGRLRPALREFVELDQGPKSFGEFSGMMSLGNLSITSVIGTLEATMQKSGYVEITSKLRCTYKDATNISLSDNVPVWPGTTLYLNPSFGYELIRVGGNDSESIFFLCRLRKNAQIEGDGKYLNINNRYAQRFDTFEFFEAPQKLVSESGATFEAYGWLIHEYERNNERVLSLEILCKWPEDTLDADKVSTPSVVVVDGIELPSKSSIQLRNMAPHDVDEFYERSPFMLSQLYFPDVWKTVEIRFEGKSPSNLVIENTTNN